MPYLHNSLVFPLPKIGMLSPVFLNISGSEMEAYPKDPRLPPFYIKQLFFYIFIAITRLIYFGPLLLLQIVKVHG